MGNNQSPTNPLIIQVIEHTLKVSCIPLNLGDGLQHFNFHLTYQHTLRVTDNTTVDHSYIVAIYKHDGVLDYRLVSERNVPIVSTQLLLKAIEETVGEVQAQLHRECLLLQHFVDRTQQ